MISSASKQPSQIGDGTAGERFDPFDYMIRSLEYGLNFSITHSGRDPSDDTVMYTPPHNWTHGQIRAWIKAIKRASLDLDEQIMKANGLMLTIDRLRKRLEESTDSIDSAK